MNLPTYYLQKHSFVCLSDRHYVILDLLADMYLRVEKEPFEALANCTYLSPLLSTNSYEPGSRELTAESRILMSELLARGLLTEHPDQASVCAAWSVAKPVQTLMSDAGSTSLIHCLPHMFSFMASARVTAAWLKQPISQTVSRVFERKRRRAHRTSEFNLDRVRALISAFCRLRPFYNRRYLCLFDSLALLNFLARYGIFPTWVFGVQSEPFAAHCWVQRNGILLNDTVDRVRVYTPILAV
jgi:hypothetical protein